MFLALVGWMVALGGLAMRDGMELLRDGLSFKRDAITAFEPGIAAAKSLAHVTGSIGLLTLVVILAIGLASSAFGSVSFRWSVASLKWSRINPGSGLKKMFGGEALSGLAMSLVKVVAVLAVTAWLIMTRKEDSMQLARLGTWTGATSLGTMILQAMMALTAVMVASAMIDIVVQWQRREARLRMTRQEVRDEHKQAEGSPEKKRAQRERQYAIASRSARKAMTDATVVLNNPTHFAVALRYRPDIDAVPVVVARGTDEVARAIRDLATENKVPQLDYPLLARAIYFTTQVGQPVRDELYLAVATVLAFVFNLDAALAAGRTAPPVDVPDSMRFRPDGKQDV